MSTSRLKIYKAALTICGERTIADLTEDREPRRLLDEVWDNQGVDACLEMAQWKFAMRSVRIDYDADVTPDYGFQRAFTKPDDWVVTSALCSDEYFRTPLTRYVDETGYWYSDIDEIYVRYVSNDASYGSDLSLWPATFADFVAANFATKIIMKLTTDEKKRESVIKWESKQLKTAKNKDAMAGPQQFPAPGNFVSSRTRGGRRDRGNRGQLIG
jgi:hypothetical protein